MASETTPEDPYRASSLAELEALRAENSRLKTEIELYRTSAPLKFNSACQACGSEAAVYHVRLFWGVSTYRILVPARRWQWQFWRPLVSYFRVQCNECGLWRKERFRNVDVIR